jgi:hypothetical protein
MVQVDRADKMYKAVGVLKGKYEHFNVRLYVARNLAKGGGRRIMFCIHYLPVVSAGWLRTFTLGYPTRLVLWIS